MTGRGRRGPLTLPGVVCARVEGMVGDFFNPPARHFDFGAPAGEPALVPADSVSWRIFKNPVAVFVGGAAAVFLELAEPRVRTGVWEHTSFRTDPVGRLQRTGLAAMATVYGARSRAKALIAGVVGAHERVRGVTPTGEPFRATDPELLDWVYATAAWGFVSAYDAYVHRLSAAEMNAAYAEGEAAGRLYGARRVPASTTATAALLEEMRPKLEPHPIVFDYLRTLRAAPILAGPLRPAQSALIRAAVELVPQWARELLGLSARHGLRSVEGALVRRAGAFADRVVIKTHPAVQACDRLGLPDDWLYRTFRSS